MSGMPERIYLNRNCMGAVCWTLPQEPEVPEGAIEYMQVTKTELTRLRNQVAASITTLVECAASDCKRGVRARNAVGGLCIECQRAELERLRGIEAAALHGQSRADAAKLFRAMAREFVLYEDRAPLFAMADALEAK